MHLLMGTSTIDHDLDSDNRSCTVCCIYFKSGPSRLSLRDGDDTVHVPFIVSGCNVFNDALLRNYRRLIDGFLAPFTQRPNKWNIEHAQRTVNVLKQTYRARVIYLVEISWILFPVSVLNSIWANSCLSPEMMMTLGTDCKDCRRAAFSTG